MRVTRCTGVCTNKHLVWWLLLTLSIGAAFARLAVHNLANFRPVSNDEVELMEVAYQLATRGVLGSDMYVGFFGADQHHLWTLPLQHVLDASAFVVFGTSVLSARLVSVVAAVVCITAVGWLAYRWYGLLAAVLCELLLTAWASDLTAAQTSLPLLGVARAARYDVVALAFTWVAIALLDAEVRRPTVSRPRAVVVGLCGGLATLAQFYAGAVLAVVVVGWLWIRGRAALSGLLWSGLGAASVLLPWCAYVALNFPDFVGQTSVYGTRGDFLTPLFYARNVLGEPLRYMHLVSAEQSAATVWLLAASVAAILWVARRALTRNRIGDRLLIASAVLFFGLLVVVDSTKTPLYAIALLPIVCLAVGGGWSRLVMWGVTRGRVALGAVAVASAAVGVALALDSAAAWQLDFAESGQVSAYLEVGARIETALEPGAVVLGPERWWWALHSHPYRSLRAEWFRWVAATHSASPPPNVRDLLTSTGAANVVVNNNVRDDVRSFPEALQTQFWDWMDRCTTLVDEFDDPTYMRIEVYRVTDACVGPQQ